MMRADNNVSSMGKNWQRRYKRMRKENFLLLLVDKQGRPNKKNALDRRNAGEIRVSAFDNVLR